MDRSNIIINGRGHTLQASGGTGFSLSSVSNVTIKNTTITNSYYGIYLESSSGNVLSGNNVANNSYYGFELDYSSGSTFSGNNVTTNNDGIALYYSCDNNTFSGNNVTANRYDGIFVYGPFDNNTFSGNNVTRNGSYGFDLYSSCDNNILSGNDITANSWGGIYLYSSSGNRIFHNDFINNTKQIGVLNSTNTWDNGYPSGGNYWSNYRTTYPNAVENDSSAIWNTPYVINVNNTDRYPLMAPFHTFGVGTWNGIAYSVDTVSNSTITNLSFNQPAKTLTFNVTGASGTTGFCRVAIPKTLMSGTWIVIVNGTSISYSVTTDANYTYIYFTYHHSTETVQIISTSAIPEFQPSMLLPLVMIITLLAAIIIKRKRNVKK